MDLRTNSDYFPIQHQLTGFCNRDGVFTARYGLDIYICVCVIHVSPKITALFWAVTQRVVVFITDVSGQPIGPIFEPP